MNKAESKYFNTARLMDEALLNLLEKYDFEYITIKQLCQKAGVNRSTFYLHYENMSDLLSESVEFLTEQFLSYFSKEHNITQKIQYGSLNDLKLVSSEYLLPYLTFVKEHKRIMQTALNKPNIWATKSYQKLYKNIFNPILERFEVAQQDKKYMLAFYLNGIMAIVKEWIDNDCIDSMDSLASLIISLSTPK